MYMSLIPKGNLPFFELGTTPGIDRVYLPVQNDGVSNAISVPTGFTLGNTTQTTVYVSG